MRLGILGAAIICALFAVPVAAKAADGFATSNVNMRSGPSTQYPAVIVIPAGAPVRIYGCLADTPWCDVSFARARGWVAGRYVQAAYRQKRVYVDPQYYRPLGIPTVTFDLGNYWDRNYRGRDFYRDRDRWRRDRNVTRQDWGRQDDDGFRPDRRRDDQRREDWRRDDPRRDRNRNADGQRNWDDDDNANGDNRMMQRPDDGQRQAGDGRRDDRRRPMGDQRPCNPAFDDCSDFEQ